jgi:hypothetical protein
MTKRILDPVSRVESGAPGERALATINSAVAVTGAVVGYKLQDPISGAALTAFGQHLVRAVLAPLLTTGMTEFVNDLAERVQQLEDAGRLRIDELLKNERFVEAVGTASRLAPFTVRDEKRRALRNAVLNSALTQDLDALEQQIFFGFIERFTDLHLVMLKLLKDPEHWPGRSGAQFGRSLNSALRAVLMDGLPALQMRPFLADQVWLELRSNNLVEGAESLDNAGEGPSVTRKRTTAFADRFLEFISSPLPER